MSEELCVCGHPKSVHALDEVGCCFDWDDEPIKPTACTCVEYRPVLPWPDSEGNWWCSKFSVPCKVTQDIDGYIVGGEAQWFRQSEFTSLIGPARFTKLLEQNPFERER